MRLDVEMLVRNPIGMVHIERQAVEPALEQGRAVDAALDVADDILEAPKAARRGCGIVDIDAHDVREVVRGLRVEELGVLRAELFSLEEHTSELQSLMRISYAVSRLTKKRRK